MCFFHQCVALIIPLFSHGAKEISSLTLDYPRFILTDQLILLKEFCKSLFDQNPDVNVSFGLTDT